MSVKRWTIIRGSGATEVLWGSASTGSPTYDYLGVLDWIGRDLNGGGSNYDPPNLLFADGKPVELEDQLSSMGYRYVTEKRKAFEEAIASVNVKWAKEL